MKEIEHIYIQTERLILRQWKNSDRDIFAQINADPEMMKFFPSTYDKNKSDNFIDKTIELIKKNNYGFFAVELKETKEFIGFVGFTDTDYEAYFVPAIEIGWRIHKKYWKKGLATEAAFSCLKYCFEKFNFDEIVACTATANRPSRNVMERIGMKQDLNGTFFHSQIPKGHKHSEHVLYRMRKDDFFASK
ncbi:MAG: GNAT family N-acetyltransferase [Halobacteriovoraceae bacterium]|nr:GNAT family N-acetyltransferase [Halobacteriovoraceae bacterium]